MYNDKLNGYHDDAYVYILGGPAGEFVSYVPANDVTSDICGEIFRDICSGYVKDIKNATCPEELPHYPPMEKAEKPKVKVLTRQPQNTIYKKSNN